MAASIEDISIVQEEEPPAHENPQEQQPQPQQLSPVPSYNYGYCNPVQPQESNQTTNALMITQPVQVIVPANVDDNMFIAVISIFFCPLIGIFAYMKSKSVSEYFGIIMFFLKHFNHTVMIKLFNGIAHRVKVSTLVTLT
ncbi:hypothetical protein PoB_002754500 [Plakobranchus ocellatus]|uniref:Transmembrane protein n=1 Tax=Plakobranchus ocellatus TaxID=259542 RepID=A0AAV4A0W2_9GAST|nr:hypothetical protein PoB_002754500 [Plakobranchus ocellatus]